jgi:NADH dehydrogenase FAD-containing subunit
LFLLDSQFNTDAKYLEAAATSIETDKRIIHCTSVPFDNEDSSTTFEVPYDRLVVAVGARSNTFGIPGVEEFCQFLKEVDHARTIRRKIVDLFERASIPGTSEKEIQKLLTFVVIGLGPTGTEFAAELRDFIEEDGPRFYPQHMKHVRIELIDAAPTVLQPFDKALQEAAIAALLQKSSDLIHFSDSITHLKLNKKVKEVKKELVILEDGNQIPYGIAVWAGGIGPLPITLDLIEAIGGRQKINQNVARGKLAVDPWMRVIDGNGRLFAIGDCTCNQGGPLPATAQVAAQEGEFLAHILNSGNHTLQMENGVQLPPRRIPSRVQLHDKIASLGTGENEYLAPFQYLDLGILAYTGHSSALAQLQITPSEKTRIKSQGRVGFGLWRSIYLVKQSSLRNQMLISFDWVKSHLFGRDITRIE